MVALTGLDILSRSNQTNGAVVFVRVKPWHERHGADESVDAIARRVSMKLFGLKEAIGFAFNLPEIPGLGATAGVETNIQNRSGMDLSEFSRQVQAFTQEVNQLPAVGGMQTNFRANVPQLWVEVDRATAKARGVQLNELFSTMQAFLSTLHQRLQPVRAHVPRAGRSAGRVPPHPEDIGRVRARREWGDDPVSALTHTEFRGGPTLLKRFNGFTRRS
jgi:multidrug efflux pump subunit AcrB